MIHGQNDYLILGSSVESIGNVSAVFSEVSDTRSIFDSKGIKTGVCRDGESELEYTYVRLGNNNRLPYEIINLVQDDEVISANKFFNLQTLFGVGVQYVDASGVPVSDDLTEGFSVNNNLIKFHAEQCLDLLMFNLVVSVVILSADRTKIVEVYHKDASHVRFEKADDQGRIHHVLVSDWNVASAPVEAIPLLDEHSPFARLSTLKSDRSSGHKFALVSRIPSPSNPYYPVPSYYSILRSKTYEMKQMIMLSKWAKVKNMAPLKYHVKFHVDYFTKLFAEKGVTDPSERKAVVDDEKRRITDYLTGAKNSGKMLTTMTFNDPAGNPTDYIKIDKIDSVKEGGDYTDDLDIIHSMFCYADQIHPNLVGATPGKSGMNNSGSDKRELFTLKQAILSMHRCLLLEIHRLVIRYNGWKDVTATMPMITLTTLDQKKDAQVVDINFNR